MPESSTGTRSWGSSLPAIGAMQFTRNGLPQWNESYVLRRQAYVRNAQALAHAACLAHCYAERRAHPGDARQVTMCEIYKGEREHL